MKKQTNIEALKEEHSILFPKCETLCQEIVHQLQRLLVDNNIKTAVPIQFRAKKWESIFEKLEQKRFNVKKSITELQDLSGVRLILLFNRDIEKAKRLIKENFDIIKEYSSEEKLKDDQFGYSSTHIIAKLKKEWLSIPTLSLFRGMQVEFQVRTLSQHSWAEASNILQYKNEDNVPKPLKRSISRISALLETVDLEYERLLQDREQYKIEINEQDFEEIDAPLNVDLLQQILVKHLPKENINDEDDYSALLSDLQIVQFDSTVKLVKLIKGRIDEVLKLDKKIAVEIKENYEKDGSLSTVEYTADSIDTINRGRFFSHTGLIRTMLIKESGKTYAELFAPSI